MPLWIYKNIEEREITSLDSSDPPPGQSAEHNGVNKKLAGSHSKQPVLFIDAKRTQTLPAI